MSVLSELSNDQLAKVAAGDFSVLTDEQLHRLEAEAAAKEAPRASEPEPQAKVIDEAHPAIRSMDRALVQNFTVRPSEKVAYLKKEYPDLEVKEDPAEPGRILVRGRGEQDFHVLSPSFSPVSHPLNTLKDLPQTLLDNAYNIASGTGVGAAAGLGAAGGALLGSPTGPGAAIPAYAGAASAGAAASGAAEAGRQKISQWLGLSKEGDTGQVLGATAAGAVAPLVFGAGGNAKGALPAAYDFAKTKVAPAVGEFFSGVPRQALRTAAEKGIPAVDALNDPQKAAEFVQGLKEAVYKKVGEAAKTTGGDLEKTVYGAYSADSAVPVDAAAAPLKQYRSELLNRFVDHPTPDIQAKVAEVDRILSKYNLRNATGDGTLDSVNAWRISQDLKNEARNYAGYKNTPSASIHDQQLQQAVREAGEGLAGALSESTGGRTAQLNQQYSKVKKDLSVLDKFFAGDEQDVAQRLSNLPNPAKASKLGKIQRIDQKYGTGIQDAAELMRSNKFLGDPAFFPVSNKGTTSTTRSLLTHGLPGAIGKVAGYATAPLTGPLAQKAYIKAGNAAVAPTVAALRNNPELLYAILQGTGILPQTPDALYGPADGGWSMLQQYIGGQQ